MNGLPPARTPEPKREGRFPRFPTELPKGVNSIVMITLISHQCQRCHLCLIERILWTCWSSLLHDEGIQFDLFRSTGRLARICVNNAPRNEHVEINQCSPIYQIVIQIYEKMPTKLILSADRGRSSGIKRLHKRM